MKKVVGTLLFAGLAMLVIGFLGMSMHPSIAHAQDSTQDTDITLTALRVDQGATDPLSSTWDAAPSLTVPLEPESTDVIAANGVTYPPISEVNLQATYTNDTLFIRSSWSDDTENDNRAFWTYTDAGWVKSSLDEDDLAFAFNISGNAQFNALGCGAVCHDATTDHPQFMGFPEGSSDTLDLWLWRASHTSPAGYANDGWIGSVVQSGSSYTGRANDHSDSGGYVNNLNDAGDGPKFTYAAGVNPIGPLTADNSVEITADMTFTAGQTLPYYVTSRPVGSRGDVSASSRYVRAQDGSGMWYVVLSRAFNTGNPEDAVFALNSTSSFGVAVLNQAGDEHHATHDRVLLNIGS